MVKTPSTDSKIKRDINTFPFTIWEPFKDFLKTRSGTSYPPRSHPWRRKSFLRKNVRKAATKLNAQGNHYCQVMVRWAKVNWHRCSGWWTIESFLLIPDFRQAGAFVKEAWQIEISSYQCNEGYHDNQQIRWQDIRGYHGQISADIADWIQRLRSTIRGYQLSIRCRVVRSTVIMFMQSILVFIFFYLSCITSQSQRGTLSIQNGRILNLESYYGSNQFFSSIGEGLAILISERGVGHIDIQAKRRPGPDNLTETSRIRIEG